MNIFVLDLDPVVAARYHCDRHVVKMITETAQILSTAILSRDPTVVGLYKMTHQHHPCVLWAGASLSNFQWLKNLLSALIGEYDLRFGRPGAFARVRSMIFPEHPFADVGLTPFALAMPEECRSEDPVSSYRSYYVKHKTFANWRNGIPDWFAPCQSVGQSDGSASLS